MGKQVTINGNSEVRLSDGTLVHLRLGNTFVFTDAEYAALSAAILANLSAASTVADPARGGTAVPLQLPRVTTAGRPAATTVSPGSAMYDVTLGKPIFSNGAVWKDAAGTTV